jgi:hypothetical protein
MISLISNYRHSGNTGKEARKVVASTTFYARVPPPAVLLVS